MKAQQLRLATVGALVLAILSSSAFATWQAQNVPVDQSSPTDATWRATTANMLAGAGYGLGRTNALRGGTIYNQLGGYSGTQNVDAAMSWWLNDSGFNIWRGNPYRDISTNPVTGASGSIGSLGNTLRQGSLVGLNVSPGIAGVQRSLSLWGDDGIPAGFAAGTGPASIILTDPIDATTGARTAALSNFGVWSMPYGGGNGTASIDSSTQLSRSTGTSSSTPLTAASSLVVTQPRDVGNGLVSSYLYLVRENDAVQNVYALDLKINGSNLAQLQYNGHVTTILDDAINLAENLSHDTHFLGYGYWNTTGNDYDMLLIQPSLSESSTQLAGAMGFGRIANPGWMVWQPVAEIVVPAGNSFVVTGQYGAGTGAGGTIQYAPFTALSVLTPEPAMTFVVACLLMSTRRPLPFRIRRSNL